MLPVIVLPPQIEQSRALIRSESSDSVFIDPGHVMYAAMRNSLSPSPYPYRKESTKLPNLEQIGQKIVLIPKSAGSRSRHSSGGSCSVTRSPVSFLSVPSDRRSISPPGNPTVFCIDPIGLANAHSNESLTISDPGTKSEMVLTGTNIIKNVKTSRHCLVKRRQSIISSQMKRANQQCGKGDEEWDILNIELKTRSSRSPALIKLSPTRTKVRPISTSPVIRQKIPIEGDQIVVEKISSSSLLPGTPSILTESSSLSSPKEPNDVTSESSNCPGCRLDEKCGEGESGENENTDNTNYDGHTCRKMNDDRDLSFRSSTADRSIGNEDPVEHMATLHEIITLAKQLSSKDSATDLTAQANSENADDPAIPHDPIISDRVISPEFSKKLLDSDEDGVGRLKGIPPISVSTSDEEEAIVKTKEERRKAFRKMHRKPIIPRKDTLDSTDEEGVYIRNSVPVELEDDTDKELEDIARRNAARLNYFSSTHSSYDMSNVDLNLAHRTISSFGSSFSLKVTTVRRRRWSSMGPHWASFVGSLPSDDGN